MPYTELLKWIEFFRSRPVGFKDDYRTYLLMRSFGYKGKMEDTFPTLRAVKQHREKHTTAGQALPKGKFLQMMMNAKNGDGSGWTPDLK
jgi:hypothetical protein